jgi:hypothetical protein
LDLRKGIFWTKKSTETTTGIDHQTNPRSSLTRITHRNFKLKTRAGKRKADAEREESIMTMDEGRVGTVEKRIGGKIIGKVPNLKKNSEQTQNDSGGR